MSPLATQTNAMSLIADKFCLCDAPRGRKVVRELLENAVRGFVANRSATVVQKFKFIRELMIDSSGEEPPTVTIVDSAASLEDAEEDVLRQKRRLYSR